MTTSRKPQAQQLPDLSALSPEQLVRLLTPEMKRAVAAADVEARKAARDQRRAEQEKRQHLATTILADGVKHLVTEVAADEASGRRRFTARVSIDGVSYNCTLVATPTKQRG